MRLIKKIVWKLRKFRTFMIAFLFPGFTIGIYGYLVRDVLAFRIGVGLLAIYFLYALLISWNWKQRAWNLLGLVSSIIALI